MAVGATVTDLAHQVHAHGVAANGEKRPVAQAQDAQVTPYQIHRDREQRVAQVLAEQVDGVSVDMQRMPLRHCHVQHGDQQQRGKQHAEEGLSGPLTERAGEPKLAGCCLRHHGLALRSPALLREESTRAFLNKQNDEDQHDNLGQHRARPRFQHLVDHPQREPRH